MGPELRPSRPTMITGEFVFLLINVAKADVNDTISTGVRLSPAVPPIVPRMPDIDLINVKVKMVLVVKLK